MKSKKKSGEAVATAARRRIRGAAWYPADPSGMLGFLKADPRVAACGVTADGAVFAAVAVADGTEAQQRAAAEEFGEKAGRMFRQKTGAPSFDPASLGIDAETVPEGGIYFNFRAEPLETACYEPYPVEPERAEPPKSRRRAPSGAPERARAYADKVRGLDAPGGRNTALAGALLNIRDKFGPEGLESAAPLLLDKSTLPETEKRRVFERIRVGKRKGVLP